MIFSLIAVLLVMLVRLWMHAEIGFYWSILMFFPYFPSLMLFSLGMGLVLSTIYVRFRDIKHIYSVFLTLWTYGTPLFYSEAILSDKVRKVMMFNPMYYYVKYFREVVAMGVWNDWRTFGICYGFGALALCVGLAVFVWRKKYIALYV